MANEMVDSSGVVGSGSDLCVEKEIFEMVTKNNIVGLQMILSKIGVADVYDENGMTPLQHAAYKGHKEMVQLLIDQGADVNSCKHEHKYTALHFAALSGSIDICLLLLLNGAKTDELNSVSRTASQMAAFVGNHECVALINNFIPKSQIELIITTLNLNSNIMISTNVLHKFLIHTNISPIRVLINLKSNDSLQKNLSHIQQILKLMLINEMTSNNDSSSSGSGSSCSTNKSNEILAFKYHYLNYILNTINNNNKTHVLNDTIELYIRKLLKSNETLDNLIKDCVREFQYRESTIFRQLIASLSNSNNTNVNNDDDLKPLSILICIINGQQYCYMLNNNSCTTCLESRPTKKCSKCKVVQYCDRECQRLHWFLHKKICQRTTTTTTTTITNNKIKNHNSTSTTTSNIIDTNEITSQIHNILLNQ